MTDTVRLRVVTTSSHNPEGCDLHIRNLKWATNDAPIYLQIAQGYPIPDDLDVDYVYARPWNFKKIQGDLCLSSGPTYTKQDAREPWSPDGFFNFYGHIGCLDFSDVDVVLFMQQDIILTEKVLELAELCRDSGTIVVNFLMGGCNTLYKRNGEIFYPRIWEGATLMPASLVREAIQENMSFGGLFQSLAEGSWLYETSLRELSDKVISSSYVTDNGPGHVELKEFFQYIIPRRQDEIMFELMLYAVHKRVPYFLLSHDDLVSPYAVHLRGIDPACQWSKGEVYSDLSIIDSIDKHRVASFKGNIAFMCLMNGTAPMDATMVKYLAMGPNSLITTTAISKYASQWMTGIELGNLSEAKDVILKIARDSRPPGIHQNIRGKLPSK